MTNEEISDGQKIIAEFMGGVFYLPHGNKLCDHSRHHWYFEAGVELHEKIKFILKYWYSWDELMPVIKKILLLNIHNEHLIEIGNGLSKVNIDTSFSAVVLFIMKYNERMKNPITINDI